MNETGDETYGMLYYAEISEFNPKLNSEMEKIELFDELPEAWTYPDIQPLLVAKVHRRLTITANFNNLSSTLS